MKIRVRRAAGPCALGIAMVIAITGAAAQQPAAPVQGPQAGQGRQGGRGEPAGRGAAPGRGGPPAARGAFAPPPIVWPAPPLPDGPIMIESAEPAHRNLRLTVIKGLSHPWGLAFLPDGAMLVTERAGRIRLIRNGVVDPAPVAGVPAVAASGLNGLLDIALHPQFAQNRFVYFTYHKPVAPAAAAAPPSAAPAAGRGRGNAPAFELVLGRGTWDGKALTGVVDVFNTRVNASASRLVFGRDGMIYMSAGNADESASAPPQDPNDLRGKVLRLRDDGSVPQDNPFVGRTGYRPEVYTMGHRTQLGLAVNPETGKVWAAEQGPNGGDEINVLEPGRNYGWPIVSQGRNYMGPALSSKAVEGMEDPVVVWIPSIAVSGMAFYTGDVFTSWKRNVFVGGLRQGEVPRTGQLQRIVFNENWEELRREPMLRELQQRIRDVRQGPDGLLYVLTEEDDAALLRIEPAGAPAAQR